MTTYYVRKTGSNLNSGSSVQDAWLTIDNAANNVAAGDTVWIGAGVYREIVTMDTSGSNGSALITFIGDVDGEITSDSGLVVVSAYADERSAAIRNSAWTFGSRHHITVKNLVFDGGTNQAVDMGDGNNNNFEQNTIEDCVIISGHDDLDYGINIDFNSGSAPATSGVKIKGCTFLGAGIRIVFDQHPTAEQDMKAVIEDCYISNGVMTTNQARSSAIMFDRISTGNFRLGGITVRNCTLNAYYGVTVDNFSSSTYPVYVTNCHINATNALWKATTNDGALISSHNTIFSQTDYTNVTAGSADRTSSNRNPILIGGEGDITMYKFLGWSPFAFGEPMRLQDDGYTSHVIGDAWSTSATATDVYDNPRPMQSVVATRGGIEARARAELEVNEVRGTSGVRFDGAGFHDLFMAVEPTPTTIHLYGRYDSNYTGTNPEVQVLNIPGAASQSAIMALGSDIWERLEVSFTPTASGVARVRMISNDSSATGQCFFDDLDIIT